MGARRRRVSIRAREISVPPPAPWVPGRLVVEAERPSSPNRRFERRPETTSAVSTPGRGNNPASTDTADLALRNLERVVSRTPWRSRIQPGHERRVSRHRQAHGRGSTRETQCPALRSAVRMFGRLRRTVQETLFRRSRGGRRGTCRWRGARSERRRSLWHPGPEQQHERQGANASRACSHRRRFMGPGLRSCAPPRHVHKTDFWPTREGAASNNSESKRGAVGAPARSGCARAPARSSADLDAQEYDEVLGAAWKWPLREKKNERTGNVAEERHSRLEVLLFVVLEPPEEQRGTVRHPRRRLDLSLRVPGTSR